MMADVGFIENVSGSKMAMQNEQVNAVLATVIDPNTGTDLVSSRAVRGVRVDKVGCPCDVTQEVHFATGSAELTAQDKALLDQLIPTLQKVHFILATSVL